MFSDPLHERSMPGELFALSADFSVLCQESRFPITYGSKSFLRDEMQLLIISFLLKIFDRLTPLKVISE